MSGDSGLNKRRGTNSFSAWREADEEGVRAVGSIHSQDAINLADESSQPEDIRVSRETHSEPRVPQIQRDVLLLVFLDGITKQQHLRGDQHERTRPREEVRKRQPDACFPDVDRE